MAAKSDIICPNCGSKAKRVNGHSSYCLTCGGRTIRYYKKGKIKKQNFHPSRVLRPI